MFGQESPENIKRILDAARPVLAWQNVTLNNADGTPPIQSSLLNKSEYRLIDSRIRSSVAEDIFSTIVVIDTPAIGAATIGHLADYVAMVSLVRIDLDADFGSSPTILRLFANKSEHVPSKLTNWDHAFLKGLYWARDPLLQQRNLIMTKMSQDLVP